MGKSRLLSSLLTDEARRACAHHGAKLPCMVYVDCLEAGDSELSFYELLLRRIVEELTTPPISAATLDLVKRFHAELLTSASDLVARSLFASSARELSREHELNLIIILDNFDDIFRSLPPWPFRELRAVRDEFGIRLSYVTATSRRLEHLCPDAGVLEFIELFYACTRVLRPLDKDEALPLIAYEAESQGYALDPETRTLVIELSGGHPGLLSHIARILSATAATRNWERQELISQLSEDEAIQQECRRLWDQLDADEQHGLWACAGSTQFSLAPRPSHLLQAKGLLVQREGGTLAVFSPVFEFFVKAELAKQEQSNNKGLRCNPQSGQIWADDREVTLGLSEPQRKLVKLLYRKAGEVVTYQEIAEEVWGAGEGVSPGAIYELVKRTRKKVEPDWTHPRYIVTVPGEGIRLEKSQ